VWPPATAGSSDPTVTGVVGAILAGGASRRMGAPKALVVADGTPLGARVAAALRAGGADRVVLVGGDPAWGVELDLPVVADRWPGLGPLGALGTALLDGADDAGAVVVAACDQPSLTGATVAALLAVLDGTDPSPVAAAPRTPDGRRHPFPSAWRPAAGPVIADLVTAGVRRADAAFAAVATEDVPVPGDDVIDVDAPADVARWQQERSRWRRSDRP
jgi:molybdenum cofactor guanylyltransferase